MTIPSLFLKKLIDSKKTGIVLYSIKKSSKKAKKTFVL